jgi:hypothetical protein
MSVLERTGGPEDRIGKTRIEHERWERRGLNDNFKLENIFTFVYDLEKRP